MPVNKNALIRYRIIDGCLRNSRRPYPGWMDLKEKIEEQIDDSISKFMIDKDLAAMKRIYNAPIRFDRTRNGYCYTEDDYSINSFPLTREEIDALDFSTALLNQFKQTKPFHQFENAINKIIDGYRIARDMGVPEHKILQVEEPVKSLGTEWLEPILKAITHRVLLSVAYQPFHREKRVHKLSPYTLKEYRNRWYVVGHSDQADSVRVLALDRIEDLKELPGRYVPARDFDPEEFFRYSFGITQIHGTPPEKVVLSFTSYQAPYILTQPLHRSQRLLSEAPDDVRVELAVYVTAELVMTVLSYGSQVRVLAPESLKQRIRETIGQIATHYGKEAAQPA